MLNKRTILFFTDTFNTAVADNIKAEFLGDNEVASVVVTKKELKSNTYNAVVKRVFPVGSNIRLFALNKRIVVKSFNMAKKQRKKINLAIHNPIQKRILNALNRYNPSVVVVTDRSILQDVLNAVDKYFGQVKVCVVPDEYILDKRFINSAVHYYFVDNYDMRNVLVDNGISDDKVIISGLPVGKKFFYDCDRASAITKFAVNQDRPTVLISASKAGDLRLKKVLDALKEADLMLDFIVACGKNRKILNYARELGFSAYNDGIDMNAALNACDVLITRPTTMLMAEAMVKGKEIYALLPNGKMETATLDYLGIDSVTKINSVEELLPKLKELADNFEELRREEQSSAEVYLNRSQKDDERASLTIARTLVSLTTLTEENS